MRRDAYGVFAAMAVGLLGCNDLEVCGSTTADITRDNGEVFRCVTSEDCPRTSRVSVCVTDVSPVAECVRCEDSRCVAVIPEAC
ncbi:hypothetical protein [Pyxidicoccus parkwayensis]|uniref:hypothetical protein n=1 Tax=Pyxidicoccus parkwayensis TaxID=2813578 RepID=UPI0035307999